MDLFLECPGSAQGALCPSEVTFCLSNPNSETIAQLSLRSTHAGRAGKAGLSRLYSPSEQGCRCCRQTDDGLPGRHGGGLFLALWPLPAVGHSCWLPKLNSIFSINVHGERNISRCRVFLSIPNTEERRSLRKTYERFVPLEMLKVPTTWC